MSVFYPRRDTWHCSSNFPAHGARFSDCYLHEEIDSRQATTLLGVSARQFWRLLAAYRKRGGDALTHGNRGRRPGNATSQEIAARVIELARDRYPDANHTHLAQLLEEREGIQISRQTLRRILAAAGLKSPRRRRPPRHRVRRERMPREGMLIQIDGSHHRWLGDDYPQLALHLAVDDATGKVLAARFRPDEDACGYFELIGESDQGARHPPGPVQRPPQRVRSLPSVLKAEAGRGRHLSSRGQCQNWGYAKVFASSAQAKGRVERAAGTFQDRLVTELRLDGASTLVGANFLLARFLERFNRQFAVAPAQPQTAYRPLDPEIDLEMVLCFRHFRRVGRDNTVRYRWQQLSCLSSPQRWGQRGCGGDRGGDRMLNGIPRQPAMRRAQGHFLPDYGNASACNADTTPCRPRLRQGPCPG